MLTWVKEVLHRSSDPLNPILLALSHLGSANPTGPSPEVSGRTDSSRGGHADLSPQNLSVSLDPTVFSQATRRDILHRNVVWYLSTLRQGNQQTKTRSTVNYSGRKLRRQKGTGKARVSDASSNIRKCSRTPGGDRWTDRRRTWRCTGIPAAQPRPRAEDQS